MGKLAFSHDILDMHVYGPYDHFDLDTCWPHAS